MQKSHVETRAEPSLGFNIFNNIIILVTSADYQCPDACAAPFLPFELLVPVAAEHEGSERHKAEARTARAPELRHN